MGSTDKRITERAASPTHPNFLSVPFVHCHPQLPYLPSDMFIIVYSTELQTRPLPLLRPLTPSYSRERGSWWTLVTGRPDSAAGSSARAQLRTASSGSSRPLRSAASGAAGPTCSQPQTVNGKQGNGLVSNPMWCQRVARSCVLFLSDVELFENRWGCT